MSEADEQSQGLSPLKRALLALKDMRAKLDAMERAKHEPIAIIGMSCRFPGGASSPAAYWELLRSGVHAVGEVPADRWDMDAYYDPDPDAPGKMNTRWGAFLDQVDQFDPHFFGISPREAMSLDPQQRLLLEVSWEALENAGTAPDRLMGSRTGVFVGISTNEYQSLQMRVNGLRHVDTYFGTGGAPSVAAGRIAYALGLNGPTMAVDTACSSSLVAVHEACQSLRRGHADLALAGGVNVMMVPDSTVCLSKVRALSSDSRCKTFDAAADGYVRGEGCGIVVLKRLSDALADGDTVLAVIRGSAINHDGRSSGLTVPSGQAQQDVIRAALADAGGLSPLQVSYAEAHGTGTPLGDPIEVRALAAVLGQGRPVDRPLMLGSVKTNIGHLEAAAGVSGLIKLVLCLQHRAIPQHLHFQKPNPHIDWDELPVRVVTSLTPWESEGPRIGCINSFGFSGTNAHVIVEEAPAAQPEAGDERPLHLLALSAKTEAALRALVRRYIEHLDAHPELSLADICHTAAAGRTHFPYRLAITAATTSQLRERLEALAARQEPVAPAQGQAARPRVAFLCTGQGAQYPGMARELYATQPVFRDALDRCAAILQLLLDRPLLDIMLATDAPAQNGASPLHQTAYTQPALFALEYALAELWRSWGVAPQAVLGHSVGEYVAAVLAGVFSLEDGLKLIAARGRLMQQLPPGGAMATLFAPAARVQALLAPYGDRLTVAAINGPEHTVISGAADAVQQLSAVFAAEGVRVQPLVVSHAFHSPLMAPMLDDFARVAASVTYHAPRLPLFSNVTGKLADASIATPAYWVEHVLAPVQFAQGMASLAAAGYDTYLELGPHPVLIGMGQACLPAGTGTWVASLRRGREDWAQLLEGLAALYVRGAAIDWLGFDRGFVGRICALPTYPFQRRRYWFDQLAQPQKPARPTTSRDGGHPLLGRQTRSPLIKEILFETEVGAHEPAYLTDHRLYGAAIFPGAGYFEMALAAAATLGDAPRTVTALTIREPLQLPEDTTRTLQLVLTPDGSGAAFQIVSSDGGATGAAGWQTHASGTVAAGAAADGAAAPQPADIGALAAEHPQELDIADYYGQLADLGLEYGPAFRGIIQIRRRDGSAFGRVALPEAADDGAAYLIHPALLDACFQLVGAALPPEVAQDVDTMYVPVGLENLRLYRAAPAEIWCEARVEGAGERGAETLTGRLRLFDTAGAVIGDLERLVLKRAPRGAWKQKQPGQDDIARWLYKRAWQPQQRPAEVASLVGGWLIYADAQGLGAALAAQLRAAGGSCVMVTPGTATVRAAAEVWEIDPADLAAPERLLSEALAGETPRGVIYLWGTESLPAHPSLDDRRAAQERAGSGALYLAQALARRAGAPPRLWIVTRGAQAVDSEPVAATHAALWGLGSVIAAEHPDLRCTCVDLDGAAPADEPGELLDEIAAGGAENQIALRRSGRFVARLVRLESQREILPDNQPYQLELPARGVLDNLRFAPLERRAPGPGEVEIEVRATGLNFRDVLNVLGMYPGDPGPPGLECAGLVSAIGDGVTDLRVGDRVVAMGTRCFDSFTVARAALVAPLPDTISFAEAVTIPSAYLTAAYGLRHLAQLKPGERVLIHAATGGVGLAAVRLAQQIGAEIFATAGSPEKHAFLRALGVRHIYSSRNLDFADAIMEQTGGQGVDVVLNSLADEFITRSVAVLSPKGRFLEIGKRGIWSAEQFAEVRPEGSYYPFELGEVLRDAPGVLEGLLRTLVAQVGQGELQPLPLRVFPATQLADAFRFMAQARHIGKVVVTHRPPGPPIRPEASYLITGGLGGIGLTVAQGLAARGARSLILVGRRAPSEAAQAAIAALREQGVSVAVRAVDIGQADAVAQLFAELAQTQPPLRGIFHAAGVLDDGVLAQQSWARFRTVFAPKAHGAWLLDRHSRGLALDWFVLCSSASALMGAAGQANYAAANAALDGLALERRAAGLPALSINWGAWGEVGMAAGLDAVAQQRLAARGLGQIRPADGLAALERLLGRDEAQVAVLPITWPTLLAQYPSGEEPPLLAVLASDERRAGDADLELSSPASFAESLAAAAPGERAGLIVARLQRQVAEVLGISLSEQLSPAQPLGELGLDSLMAVELKNRVETRLGVALPVSIFLEGPSIDTLVGLIEERLAAPESAEAAGDAIVEPAPENVLLSVDQLSDDDVSAMLSSLLAERGLPQ